MSINGNGVNGEAVVFNTQGSVHSWHAFAAKEWAKESGEHPKVVIKPHDRFGDVVSSCRTSASELAIMAMRTAVGTIDESAGLVITEGEAALPPIIGRVDVKVRLALIGTPDHDFDELVDRGGKDVKCVAQEPAWLQCVEGIRKYLPWIKKPEKRHESTAAILEAIERNDPNVIALGPTIAVRKLGGIILGPRQINPRDSVTSFYIMQRDPMQQILGQDPAKTETRTVLSLTHPDEEESFARCMEIAEQYGVQITRYIPFNGDKIVKEGGEVKKVLANKKIKAHGGLLEIAHGLYDEETTEFRARVHHMKMRDGVTKDAFRTHRLGMFPWYPEEAIEPTAINGTAHLPSETKVPHRTLL